MEYAGGGTLASKINADLSMSDTKKWALQLVKVLKYIRKQGVAHRDLKPENVLLSAEGNIKVPRRSAGLLPAISSALRQSILALNFASETPHPFLFARKMEYGQPYCECHTGWYGKVHAGYVCLSPGLKPPGGSNTG